MPMMEDAPGPGHGLVSIGGKQLVHTDDRPSFLWLGRSGLAAMQQCALHDDESVSVVRL